MVKKDVMFPAMNQKWKDFLDKLPPNYPVIESGKAIVYNEKKQCFEPEETEPVCRDDSNTRNSIE